MIDFINTEELSIVVPQKNSLPIIKKGKLDALSDDEIRVKMLCMGYCGRDRSILTGQKTANEGRIGHEGAGVIVETGSSVKRLKVGQNVVIYPFINRHNIGYDWPEGGKGIFSNYASIPNEAVYPISEDNITPTDWLSYALIEPFAGIYRGLLRGNIINYDILIILGAGSIGCGQAMLAKYLNPSIKVVLVDISKIKIQVAKKLNIPADYFLHLDSDGMVEKSINDISSKHKNPLIIHSNPFKESIKQAFKMASDKSTILFFSGVYDWGKKDDLDLGFTLHPKKLHYEEYDEELPEIVFYNQKRIKTIGSRGFSKEDFNYIAELIITKKFNPLTIVTSVIKYDENILDKLLLEGEKDTNIKILMTPYDDILNCNVVKD